MNCKRLLCLASIVLLLFGTAGMLWAYGDASYNRPYPLMDYVPQELGIYDGVYGITTTDPGDPYQSVLTETDCRLCHGVSLADRHHATLMVTRDGECSTCHPTVEDPPGVTINRNCTADVGDYGCHSWTNARDGVNLWHHTSSDAAAGLCTTCHYSAFLDQFDPTNTNPGYPPSDVTPTPFSCENCHWQQDVVADSGTPQDRASIILVTQANPGVVTTNGAHSFNLGDIVEINNVQGMTELNGNTYMIGGPFGPGTDNFRLKDLLNNPIDTTGFAVYDSQGDAWGNNDDLVAGHPSTFDHYNRWKTPQGYFEYGKKIYQNFETHHFDADWPGEIAPDCWRCHRGDPVVDGLDPDDPEIIRWCEQCHSGYAEGSLHRIRAHIGMVDPDEATPPDYWWEWQGYGWAATGFHSGTPSTDTATIYRPFTADGDDDNYPNPPTGDPNIDNRDGMCWGCHGDLVDPWVDPGTGVSPTYTSHEPIAGCCTTYVTITGAGFGDTQIAGREVQGKEQGSGIWGPANPTQVTVTGIVSWTDTRIVFELPCWTWWQPVLPGDPTYGNLVFRVVKEDGDFTTNFVFSLQDCTSPTSISASSPPVGPCGVKVALSNPGATWGTQPTQMATDLLTGRTMVIDFVGSQGTFTVKAPYHLWTNTLIKVYFDDFYQDIGDTLLERNFVQDGEPDIYGCSGMALGTYAVYLRYILFTDDGTVDDEYDAGDHIYSVESSNAVYFELANRPYIYRPSPTEIEVQPIVEPADWLKLIGLNFGTVQGDWEVWMGFRGQAIDAVENGTIAGGQKQLDKVKYWSPTKIRLRFRVPAAYQGQTKYIWLENPVTGETSCDFRPIFILP